jgi:peroxiredoxin family protein
MTVVSVPEPVATAVHVAAEVPEPAPAPASEVEATPRDILIINYSGELEKIWAAMILATTAATMGKVRVFMTFWGLQNFVKDERRITGQNWMQKMLSFMQRPGISHRKLSKMNFLGMGPWMMFKLAKQYKAATPKDLLEIGQAMGVEFVPCQMTMDLFGLTREDLIDGLAEPVGAATVIALMQEGSAPLFI